MEKLLSQKFKDEFAPQVRARGVGYYNDEMVYKCFKAKDDYIAKVFSSDDDMTYTVRIELQNDELVMSCTCPYEDNCKHEYATLLCIDNKKYSGLELLPFIDKEEPLLVEFLQNIPEKELKQYLVKLAHIDNFNITEESLKNHFAQYLTKDTREYFYNTLYNTILMDDCPMYLINDFADKVRTYVDAKDYEYAFLILSTIIDALFETKKNIMVNIDTEKLMDIYLKLGTYVRICYRKSNDELKAQIKQWIAKFENEQFNGDAYLEDFLLSIK